MKIKTKIMDKDQLLWERAEQLARKRHPGIYYSRNDSHWDVIHWNMCVRECMPRAAYELAPEIIRRRWVYGRLLVSIRQSFYPINRFFKKVGLYHFTQFIKQQTEPGTDTGTHDQE